MNKKAVISLRSLNDLDSDDIIEVVTPGEFLVIEGGFKAIYEETELSGMSGTTTTSVSLYNTPYGVLDLQIHTEDLNVDIDENGGKITAKYSMELAGQPPIVNKLSVNVKTN